MTPFSLLVKPAGPDCNLRCRYCFYLDRCALYPDAKRHRMSEAVLERMVASYMATDQPQYAFGWQGGEPTLMGLDFFRRVTALQEKHGRRGAQVANGLQTNATLIDDDFARHLAQYRFLLGVSLDGPADVHDANRLTADGRGSHAAVLRAVECLRSHDVEFNILVLVNRANVDRPRAIYDYLCEHGFLFHQYIPCAEFDDEGRPLPFSITGEEWGDFLCGIYDAWLPRDTRRVSVRHFDSVLNYLVDGVRNVCCMGDNCCQYLVVEHNGDVYPCDFFVRADLKIGNIMEDSWEELQASPLYRDFGAQKRRWNEACGDCPWGAFCMGDCLKHRLYLKDDPKTLSWLCAAWKRFYPHALAGFRRLAGQVRAERRRAEARARVASAPRPAAPAAPASRNAPCPCGSGLKYKKCCGAAR
jgi:uncharacterized protein